MEPYPGLLSMLESQHRINRYQTMEIASLRTQTTALTNQMTAAAAGLTAADFDRREAIAHYDLLHADFAIKVTELQHLRKALEQRNAAIRLQQEQIAALEKKVHDLQQEAQPGAALPSPEADTVSTPPSVMTPPPSRGRLSQLAASSVPNLPAVRTPAPFVAALTSPPATRQIGKGATPQGQLRPAHHLAAREVQHHARAAPPVCATRDGARSAGRGGRQQAHDAALASAEASE